MEGTNEEMITPQREKYWHERTDAEKINKLASLVSRLWEMVGRLEGELEKMRYHKHLDGEIVVCLHRNEVFVTRNNNPLNEERKW